MESVPLTAVVADREPLIRGGICRVLESELAGTIVAQCADTATALEAVLAHRPEVLVVGARTPGSPTLPELARQIAHGSPDTHVLVLAEEEDPGPVRAVLAAGASGCILRSSADTELANAVRFMHEGRGYLDPMLGARLASTPGNGAFPGGLTEREAEVLGLVALGHTNPEIAERLFLSVRTIETHRARIQKKTRTHTRAELVGYAMEHGLVPAPRL